MCALEKQTPEALTRKQKDIVEEIEGIGARLKKFDHFPAEKMEELVKNEAIAQIFKEYERVILKALRAEIDDHLPKEDRSWNRLYRWVLNTQILGEKTRLRKARRGLEVGVKRPLKKKEAELLKAVEEIRWGRGKSITFQVSEDELSSPLSMEDIIQLVNKRMVFDPDNSPQEEKSPTHPMSLEDIIKLVNERMVFNPDSSPQGEKSPTPWTQVHKILRLRKLIKMSRQDLLRKIKRLQD